ncbi:MAG: chemotaxis protein CheA [Lachnospiraceae bacterium]|nr:chemotaxis protein CheA [Lachnospiraceae bacterium]
MDVSQYLDIFIDETNEHIQSLSDNIMVLEKEPENKDTINEIFRAAHSLKGMAGTMGFKRMQRLTHDMENVFSEVRNDTIKIDSGMIDTLFQCLDAIENYLASVKASSDEGTEDNEHIIEKLNSYLPGAANAAAKDKAPAAETKAEEAPAPAEAPEEEGNRAYLEMPLDDAAKDAIGDAAVSSKIYGFTVSIQKDCLLKAARAFLVFKAIEDSGEILAYNPSSQDIEDEKFDLDFSIIISTKEDVTKIKAAIESVSEIEKAVYGEIPASMYSRDDAAGAVSGDGGEEDKQASDVPESSAVVPASKSEPSEAVHQKSSAPAQKKAAGKPVTARTVRVDIEKLDALMNQVSELIIAKNSLVSISDSGSVTSTEGQQLHEQIEYLERITTTLHESVMKVRMVPIESTVNKFPRMIRDLSRKLNKPMDLVMTGEDTELDRTVVDQIGDPLQHLLRNSADHGIEDPDVREKAGKPRQGNIFLNAFQEGNNVIIQVGDDGGGIDTDAVKAKAISRGLVSEEDAEKLSQKEIIDFLFNPGFSMSKTITDISGRGVGLDVVKSNVEALGGDVTVKSTLGQGSTFTVRLPLTLAIIQALMVEIADEKYAIALASISNIENISVKEIKYVEANEVIHLRGRVIPLIRMRNVLDCPEKKDEENLTVVIVSKGDNLAGLIVDNLIGQQEIVIKSIGKVIDSNKIISGATILGDGEVAMILDINALM